MKSKNFITNDPTKNLKERIFELARESSELKFLVGFFYFSGLKELYEGLNSNNNFLFKVLVGLKVDLFNSRLIEIGYAKGSSNEQKIKSFFDSIIKSINTEEFDNKEFYQQASFFINLIKQGKLKIRQTYEPNHAKLYLFKFKPNQIIRNELFITGSSNLTRSGLVHQNEFNVEISDYGFEDAEKYFDELWNKGVEITEKNDYRNKLIEIIEKQTHLRNITEHKLSPFEAYLLVLKTYLETYEHKDLNTIVLELFEMNGYKKFQYQLDAIKQALAIIGKFNGVLLADVVGLGKTIIACAIAKQLNKRGLVICPPGLIGDDNKTEGWKKYLDQFRLYDWEVRSLGDLEKTLEYVQSHNDIEVVIVDEAHRFRNQDTKGYEYLKNICRGKIVILLTATPFNNKPEDLLSILSLFIPPKKSNITLNGNLIHIFRFIGGMFDKLGYIKKNYNSSDPERRFRAQEYYEAIFNENQIQLKNVQQKAQQLAKIIRNTIEPVTIRRNRLDLLKNPKYKDEVSELSEVAPPKEWLYKLNREQSEFYDEVISRFFAQPDEGGEFKGAIYRPYHYEVGIQDGDYFKIEGHFEQLQQQNLYDIMRRLLVKRFESSFGAFKKSVENFIQITQNVLKFIEKTGKGDPKKGEYILDRDLLESILELDEEEIEEKLQEYEKKIAEGVYPKRHKRYKIQNFKEADKFLQDIQSDLDLFKRVLNKIEELKLVENDPKAECLLSHIQEEFSEKLNPNEPKRKIVIFSEYSDTVKHLQKVFEQKKPKLASRTLVIWGSIAKSKFTEIIKNFDASIKEQSDDYDILLTTDKLSEGFNLNRAGMVINYDIPWNPVRVIQRLGRINRISKKVFDKLYIVNFFPTEQGAEYVRSKEIAQNKMFMIHKTLGEDSKIFDPDEEPSPSLLYRKLTQNPEEIEEESFYTKIASLYHKFAQMYPNIVNQLENVPPRIKVAKHYTEDEMLVFYRKNRLYVKLIKPDNGKNQPQINDTSLEDVLDNIQCSPDTPSLPIDEEFWNMYELAKFEKQKISTKTSEISIESKALNNIKAILAKNTFDLGELFDFIETLRNDIIDYGTLPDFTLRRISQVNPDNKEEIIEVFNKIRNELGNDYLEKIKKKMEGDKELIIAIRNVKKK